MQEWVPHILLSCPTLLPIGGELWMEVKYGELQRVMMCAIYQARYVCVCCIFLLCFCVVAIPPPSPLFLPPFSPPLSRGIFILTLMVLLNFLQSNLLMKPFPQFRFVLVVLVTRCCNFYIVLWICWLKTSSASWAWRWNLFFVPLLFMISRSKSKSPKTFIWYCTVISYLNTWYSVILPYNVLLTYYRNWFATCSPGDVFSTHRFMGASIM